MAAIWSMRFVLNSLIFAQIFFLATDWKVLASTNVDKGKCIGKYLLLEKTNESRIWLKMDITYNNFDEVPTISTMENNGHTLKIELDYNDNNVPTIEVDFRTAFGVRGIFRFKFLYFQWRKAMLDFNNYKNVSIPAELHVVFYDTKAESYEDAISLRKSIIVLAFKALVIPEQDNFHILTDNLQHVREANSKTSIDNVDLNDWARTISPLFIVHEGSLLESDCEGTVLWIDYLDPILIAPTTEEEFQKLKATDGNPLMDKIIDISEPKGFVVFSTNSTSRAKKNNIEMPGLIIGILFIFCLV